MKTSLFGKKHMHYVLLHMRFSNNFQQTKNTH